MDTSDPQITFDLHGVCNHCTQFERVTRRAWFPGVDGVVHLEAALRNIRRSGRGHKYDCILGLSGGVDSSFLALRVREWGLRPLVVHVDAGWNSELAVANIEAIVRHCKYDLHTHVVDWRAMRGLHLAFLRSGIANQDVPQDHAFFASLYHFAVKNGIRYILSGGNIATEGIFPKAWHGSAMDAINLRAIHRQFGDLPLGSYNTISWFQYYVGYPLVRRMRTVRPLNFLPYVKAAAVRELVDTVGYKPYERKHGESQFTKLFQNHYLPKRFGFDKRRPHFSSLIVSGQMAREEALARLREPLYMREELCRDIEYVCKKLGITPLQFDEFMKLPIRHYAEFPNWDRLHHTVKWIQGRLGRVLGRRLANYS